MQKKLRHSKFKNTGILFELLTKQVTADIISGKDISEAKSLIYKYFRENTELGKEWQLYNTLLTEKDMDESHAERFLSVIIESRKKLSNSTLSLLKYNLIKELKNYYPVEGMLKSPIKNYRILASIYKVFENITSSDYKFDIKEVYKAKNCIIEHIVNKPITVNSDDVLMEYYASQSEDIRLLTYKLLCEKFNEKYESILDEEQKQILREYICNIANSNKFDVFINNKIKELRESIEKNIEKISDSDVIKIKIKEVIHQLSNITSKKIIKENHISVLMLGYELIKEINNII